MRRSINILNSFRQANRSRARSLSVREGELRDTPTGQVVGRAGSALRNNRATVGTRRLPADPLPTNGAVAQPQYSDFP